MIGVSQSTRGLATRSNHQVSTRSEKCSTDSIWSTRTVTIDAYATIASQNRPLAPIFRCKGGGAPVGRRRFRVRLIVSSWSGTVTSSGASAPLRETTSGSSVTNPPSDQSPVVQPRRRHYMRRPSPGDLADHRSQVRGGEQLRNGIQGMDHPVTMVDSTCRRRRGVTFSEG